MVNKKLARKIKLIFGTSYFSSTACAIRYYKPYGYADVKTAVACKIAKGEIHIGPPPVRPDRTHTLDSDGRYIVTAYVVSE